MDVNEWADPGLFFSLSEDCSAFGGGLHSTEHSSAMIVFLVIARDSCTISSNGMSHVLGFLPAVALLSVKL